MSKDLVWRCKMLGAVMLWVEMLGQPRLARRAMLDVVIGD